VSPLLSPEDGRRTSFQNVVIIVSYFIRTMDKVQKTIGSQNLLAYVAVFWFMGVVK
jgi:hypothetical protein